MNAPPSPPRFGATGFGSAVLCLVAFLMVRQARSQHFSHGAELAWVYAYMIPLFVALLALLFGGIHLLRGRIRSALAWVPVACSMALVAWLIAYLYFDAFRTT